MNGTFIALQLEVYLQGTDIISLMSKYVCTGINLTLSFVCVDSNRKLCKISALMYRKKFYFSLYRLINKSKLSPQARELNQ